LFHEARQAYRRRWEAANGVLFAFVAEKQIGVKEDVKTFLKLKESIYSKSLYRCY
jgi:hypothetical protein